MKQNSEFNFAFKLMRLAVASAIPLFSMAGVAHADGCSTSADNLTVTCSGTISMTTSTSGLTLYDVAAATQPTSGSNSYTPTSYSHNPQTLTVNINSGTTISGSNVATGGNDKGLITANYSNAENPAVNNVIVNNNGAINLTSGSVASRANAINSDSQVNSFMVKNNGTITVDNRGSIGAVTSPATTVPVTSTSNTVILGTPSLLSSTEYSASAAPTLTDKVNNIAVKGTANAIYADDNTNSINVVNNSTGAITAIGNYATGYAGRANFTLDNFGLFGNSSWTSSASPNQGLWAIAAWGGAPTWGNADPASANPDSPTYLLPQNTAVNVSGIGYVYQQLVGDVNSIAVTNEKHATINGDILAVDQSIYAWGPNGGSVLGIFSSSTNGGPIGSLITNYGTINGNIYWGSGDHTLVNTGTINGNISADQEQSIALFTETAGNKYLAYFNGDRTINITNAGTISGNLTISNAVGTQTVSGQTVASSYGAGQVGQVTSSNINYSPVVFASGAGSTANSPSTNVGQVGGTLSVTAAPSTANNNSFVASNVNLKPMVAQGVVVQNGEWFKIANAVGGVLSSSNLPTLIQPSTSGLLTWTEETNSSGNLVIGATVVDAKNVNGISNSGANALNALMGFNSTLGSTVQSLSSADQVRQAAEQLRPEVNGGSYQAITNTSDKFFNIVDSHLTSSYAGVGSASQELNGAWMQAFGSQGNQDTRNGIDGFKLESYGVAVGADHLTENNIRVGLAGSYAQSNVNDQGVNLGNTSTIKSYQGSIYASKDFNGTYINALLGLGNHDISSVRQVLGNAVDGSHIAWQYSAKLDVGHPINYNILTLVPVASVAYSHLSENAFTESGIGALSINSKDTDSFKTGLGFKGLLPLPAASNLHGNLEFRALWNHEFANTAQDTTATFVGGTNAFTVSGINPERDSADLGASLRLTGGGDVVKQSVSLNYDANVKSQYVTQYVTLNARFDF